MAKSAGVITIRMKAGTAELFTDMDKAKAKVREFGGSAKASNAEVAATVKALEGNFNGATRAVARFLNNTLGLGPVMAAAFPVVGAVLLGKAVFDTAAKVREFFQDVQQGPEKVSRAFREMGAPLRMTNDELRITNDRLENDIAKLEGHRQNTLKLALDEARKAADQLADSLDKDLTNLNKLLKEQSHNWLAQMFGAGAAGKDAAKLFGGETGFGGYQAEIQHINDVAEAKIRAAAKAKDAAAAEAAARERDAALLLKYQQILGVVNRKIEESEKRAKPRTVETVAPGFGTTGFQSQKTVITSPGAQADVEVWKAIRDRFLLPEMERLPLESQKDTLTKRKDGLEAAAENAKIGQPYKDRMNQLAAQLEAARAKLTVAGGTETEAVVVKGYSEAVKAIQEVNKALEEHHQKLTDAQMGQLSLKAQQIASAEAEASWKEKLSATTDQLRDQIRAQQMLAIAIGQGYAAVRAAQIETKVMQAVTPGKYNDPAWMKSHAGDVAQIRAGVTAEYDAARHLASAQAVSDLETQIGLENRLAEAQRLGEAEIRRITALEIWRAGIEKGLTGQQIAAQIELFYAKERTRTAADIAKLNAETEATNKLSAAQLRGAEAARKQALENKYAEMERTGHAADVPAQRKADEAAYQAEVTKRVADRVNLYADELQKLDQERDRLLEIIGEHQATVDQQRALRDLQNERIALWVKEQLAIGTARAGIRAFFGEMQLEAKRVGNIIYDTLTSAVDRVSDELSKLMTGQKADFGKMFQELGQEEVRESVKAGIQKGLGQLGKLFGIKMPEGKPDGTREKPFHVIVDNGAAQGSNLPGQEAPGAPETGTSPGIPELPLPPPIPLPHPSTIVKDVLGTLGKLIGGIGGLFGGGAGGASSGPDWSGVPTMSLEHREGGGPVSPDQAYIVGERGIEVLYGASGRVVNNASLQRTFGGGGDQYFFGGIDARGADLGAGNRVSRAIETAHSSAIANSIRANAERAKRTPQRAKGAS